MNRNEKISLILRGIEPEFPKFFFLNPDGTVSAGNITMTKLEFEQLNEKHPSIKIWDEIKTY